MTEERELRDRFGFFGQLTPLQGSSGPARGDGAPGGGVERPDDSFSPRSKWLPAIGRTAEERKAKPHARIHGANLDLQPGTFQNRVEELLDRRAENVTFAGRYSYSELASLMSNVDWVVVPSIWWENSPLVIQEAFHFGRPVICSDIGGMAEKVDDGVNGLHFRAGDPTSLARTIKSAAEEPGLWEQLRNGIRPMYAMDEHMATLAGLYDGSAARKETVVLVEKRAAKSTRPKVRRPGEEPPVVAWSYLSQDVALLLGSFPCPSRGRLQAWLTADGKRAKVQTSALPFDPSDKSKEARTVVVLRSPRRTGPLREGLALKSSGFEISVDTTELAERRMPLAALLKQHVSAADAATHAPYSIYSCPFFCWIGGPGRPRGEPPYDSRRIADPSPFGRCRPQDVLRGARGRIWRIDDSAYYVEGWLHHEEGSSHGSPL